jgi:hypothetical protein
VISLRRSVLDLENEFRHRDERFTGSGVGALSMRSLLQRVNAMNISPTKIS